jgi:hypothetical protein
MILKLLRCLSFCAAAGILAIPAAVADADSDHEHVAKRVPLPVIKTFKGEECVEPEDVIRRNHMKFILHQRDKTMHQGIRTTKYSLKNCVNCHADPQTNSVLGENGFCSTCHQYAAVSIDCFTCHTDKAEPQTAAAPAEDRVGDMMNQSNVLPPPTVRGIVTP